MAFSFITPAVFDGLNYGLVPRPASILGNFLRDDGTWDSTTVAPFSGTVSGSVTAVGSSNTSAFYIGGDNAPHGVFSNSQNGLVPGPSGIVGDVLADNATWVPLPVIPGVFTSTVNGLVPSSGADNTVGFFLAGNGTWQPIPAGGSPFSGTVTGLVTATGASNTSAFYIGGDNAPHAVVTYSVFNGTTNGLVPHPSTTTGSTVLADNGTWVTGATTAFGGATGGGPGTLGLVPAPSTGETGQLLLGNASWTPFNSLGIQVSSGFAALGGNPNAAVALLGTTVLGVSTALIEGSDSVSVEATSGLNWIGNQTGYVAGFYNNSGSDGVTIKVQSGNAAAAILDLSTGTTPSGAGTKVATFTPGGTILGAATGGTQGAGTINTTGLYVNGVSVGLPSVFTGASSGAAGSTGLVPQPLTGQQAYQLLGNATWVSPSSLIATFTTNGAGGAPGYISPPAATHQFSVMNAAGTWANFFGLNSTNSFVVFGSATGDQPLRGSSMLSLDQGTNSPSLVEGSDGNSVNATYGINWAGNTAVNGYLVGFASINTNTATTNGVLALKINNSLQGDILNCSLGNAGAITGAGTAVFRVTAGNGVIVGVPTGGGQGAGTINSTGLYVNGTQILSGAQLNVANTWTAAQTFNNGDLILTGLTSGSSTLKAPATGGGTITFPQGSVTLPALGTAQTWTAAQTFGNGNLLLAGSSSGSTTLEAPATGGNVNTFPAAAGTVALINFAQTWTSAQTFGNGNLMLAGSSSGTTTLEAPATGGAVNTFPAATGTVALINTNQTFTGTQSFAALTTSGILTGNSIVAGAATGGSQGAGTVNATGYYVNGALVTSASTTTPNSWTGTNYFQSAVQMVGVNSMSQATAGAAVSGVELGVGRQWSGSAPIFGSGQSTGDLAFCAAGSGQYGIRHFILSLHDTASVNQNWLAFYINNSATNAGSSAPGTGNALQLTIASNGLTLASPTSGAQGTGTLNATGLFVNGTAVAVVSDVRLKDVGPLTSPVHAALILSQLKVHHYQWKEGTEQAKKSPGDRVGIIAQDVAKVFKQGVHIGTDDPEIDPYYLLPGEFLGILILNAQSQAHRIKALEEKLEAVLRHLGE